LDSKYLIILIDGMADYQISELEGKTPLEKADTPCMDKLAVKGQMGTAKMVPDSLSPGSDVANLSVLGYDPQEYYTGRSPYEALSMGVELSKEDIAFRCNLVTLSEEREYDEKIMKDYSAGNISTPEAEELINECRNRLGNEEFHFFSGMGYRHLLVWRNGDKKFRLTPPHDISGKMIGDYLPEGRDGKRLLELMYKSSIFLETHPVNQIRSEKGESPANSIWFWGEGTKPHLPDFKDKFNFKGSVISAVHLIKGLGKAAGLEVVNVKGATGDINTNFYGKAHAAVEQLKNGDDFVFLHLEAADEAGHQGDLETKIKAIELADKRVVSTVLEDLSGVDDYSIMVLADHPTPVSKRTHTLDPVPFLIYRNREKEHDSNKKGFSEQEAEKSGWHIENGYELIDYFVEKE